MKTSLVEGQIPVSIVPHHPSGELDQNKAVKTLKSSFSAGCRLMLATGPVDLSVSATDSPSITYDHVRIFSTAIGLLI